MGWFGRSNSEEENEESIYEFTHECINCLEEHYFKIPKGTKKRDFLYGKICESCDCPIIYFFIFLFQIYIFN